MDRHDACGLALIVEERNPAADRTAASCWSCRGQWTCASERACTSEAGLRMLMLTGVAVIDVTLRHRGDARGDVCPTSSSPLRRQLRRRATAIAIACRHRRRGTRFRLPTSSVESSSGNSFGACRRAPGSRRDSPGSGSHPDGGEMVRSLSPRLVARST